MGDGHVLDEAIRQLEWLIVADMEERHYAAAWVEWRDGAMRAVKGPVETRRETHDGIRSYVAALRVLRAVRSGTHTVTRHDPDDGVHRWMW